MRGISTRSIAALRALGYTVFGPRVRDESVVIDEIESAAMLPAGWEDQQERGRYTLTRTDSPRLFGITHGAHSWKRLLHPPTVRLWRAERGADGLQFTDGDPAPRPMALVGVRPCELKAIHVQDGVLLDPHASDAVYRARREPAFIVVVQCARAGGTCFCASMETGPRARAGFDLALTEMVGPDGHWFLAEVGTHRGAEVLMLVGSRPATTREITQAERSVRDVAAHMGRRLDTADLPARLAGRYGHAHWDELEARCLACGNCTLVCPTCFCTTVQDHADLGRHRVGSHPSLGHVLRSRVLVHPRRQRAPFHARAVPPVAHAQALHLACAIRDERVRRLRPLHHLVSRRHRYYRGGGGGGRNAGSPRTDCPGWQTFRTGRCRAGARAGMQVSEEP